MRAVLALSLLISVPAMAKLELDLMPLSGVGEGASISIKSPVILPANETYKDFNSLVSRGENRFEIYSCSFNFQASPRLRRMSTASILTVTESKLESETSTLSFGENNSLSCSVSSFTSSESPETLTYERYYNESVADYADQGSRVMTVLEFNTHMPFNVSVAEIDNFAINDDENEESIVETSTPADQNGGASQEAVFYPAEPVMP